MKRIVIYASAIFLVVGSVILRMTIESRNEYRAGVQALSVHQMREAIIHFDRSIHWYFPGNPFPKAALNRLEEIASQQESKDTAMALLAYDSMRGGIYAIRSLYTPYANLLPHINDRIAQLRTDEQIRENPGQSRADVLAFHQRVLAKDERPKTLGLLMTEIGFFSWVASVFLLIWKGCDREGKFYFRSSLPWIVSFAGSFVLWILGLLSA